MSNDLIQNYVQCPFHACTGSLVLFVGSCSAYTDELHQGCPCNTDSGIITQSFIGDDYLSEAAVSGHKYGLYIGDPVWNGELRMYMSLTRGSLL